MAVESRAAIGEGGDAPCKPVLVDMLKREAASCHHSNMSQNIMCGDCRCLRRLTFRLRFQSHAGNFVPVNRQRSSG